MFIVLAILAFGVLIFVHEAGHFIAAKCCGVKVLEFAMGMGPRIFHFTKGETEYSLRALPVGGFCAMEGEDGESDSPRSFAAQSVWKRLIILSAGSFMNFLLGLFLVCILLSGADGYPSAEIAGFFDNCPYADVLQEGDVIWSVNGERVYFLSNFNEYVNQGNADGTIDLVIKRDGKKIKLNGYSMVPLEYRMEDGTTALKFGLYFTIEEPGLGSCLRYSWYTCLDFARMIRLSLTQLIAGRVSVQDVTGVVGMVDLINEAGQSAETTALGVENVVYLVAFIAVNLAVMNMLPIPALDGGHILTLLVSKLIEKIIGRKPNPNIENYIHVGGLVLLLGFMLLVMYNDIARIVTR